MDAEGCYKFNACMVFYTHRGNIGVLRLMPGDATNSASVLCFTRIEAISGYRDGCRGMLRSPRLYCVLCHASKRYQGTMMDAEGCCEFSLCILFTRIEAMWEYHYRCRGMLQIQRWYCVLHVLSGIRVPLCMPRGAMNSMFALRFTRLEAMPGYHYRCRGMLQIQRLYRVSPVRRPYQSTIMHAKGTKNSTFALCFTRLEAISGYDDPVQRCLFRSF